MAIKKNDFVELEYTGRIKEENLIFDTTNEKTAKDNNLFNKNAKYGPITICIGQGLMLKGLEQKIEGKELGKHTIELSAEQAFGKKNTQLIQLIPLKKFLDQKINPVPGLQLNIDGLLGTIRKVGGGRVIVDFNHPLASRDVVYEVELKKIITDTKEKIKSFLKQVLGQEQDVKLNDKKASIDCKIEIPDNIKTELIKKIKELAEVDAEFITAK